MGVTVGELLQIDILKNASVIAGASGMNRQIRRVSFSDVPLEEWKDPTCFEPGDVFIRSFFADKDREERICEAISFYIQVNSACCITGGFSPISQRTLLRWLMSTITPSLCWMRSFLTPT